MPTPTAAVLAVDRISPGWDPTGVVRVDGGSRGAVAARVGEAAVRRAEPGPCGPLRCDAALAQGDLVITIRGPRGTPLHVADAAVVATRRWVGVDDDPAALDLRSWPRLRHAARQLGTPRLGCLTSVGEAFGRAVIAQLVQVAEARRSMAQLAALAGTPAGDGLWTWPTGQQIGATPAWAMRRCGLSLRSARALHAGIVEERKLGEAARVGAWEHFDRRMRRIPGVGVWTSAKARAALGDPDAVAVGDWNLPAVVCTALTGEDRGRTGWTDDDLLALLEPFSGQRARAIRLVTQASRAGMLPRHRRRAPRAALSAHRYW